MTTHGTRHRRAEGPIEELIFKGAGLLHHGHTWHETSASYDALNSDGKHPRSWPTWALDACGPLMSSKPNAVTANEGARHGASYQRPWSKSPQSWPQ